MRTPADGEVAVAELEEPAPWRTPVPFLWLAIAILVSGALAALATGAADAPDGAGDDARSRIVAAAGSTTARDFAFSTTMAFEDSDQEHLENLSTTMEGRYDADTGRMHARTTVESFETEYITDGRVRYLRFPEGGLFAGAAGGKPWGRTELADRPDPGSAGDITDNPLTRLAELGKLRSPVVRLGEEQVRGVDTVRYRTKVAGSDGEEDATLEVWLDGDDRLRRHRLSSMFRDTRYTMSFEVYDVGQAVTIDLPPEDQVGPFDPKDLIDRRPTPEGD